MSFRQIRIDISHTITNNIPKEIYKWVVNKELSVPHAEIRLPLGRCIIISGRIINNRIYGMHMYYCSDHNCDGTQAELDQSIPAHIKDARFTVEFFEDI